MFDSFTAQDNGVYVCLALLRFSGRGNIQYQVSSSVITVGGINIAIIDG